MDELEINLRSLIKSFFITFLSAYCFFLFFDRVSDYTIIGFVSLWLLNESIKVKLIRLKKWEIWLFSLPFFFALTYHLYDVTNEVNRIAFEVTITMIIFPVVLGTSKKIKSKNFDIILLFFILGLIYFLLNLPEYIKANRLNYTIKDLYFSFNVIPLEVVYYLNVAKNHIGLALSFGLYFSFYFIIKLFKMKFNLILKIISITLLFLLSIELFLVQFFVINSRSNLFVSVILIGLFVLGFIIYQIKNNKSLLQKVILISFLVISSIIITYLSIDKIKEYKEKYISNEIELAKNVIEKDELNWGSWSIRVKISKIIYENLDSIIFTGTNPKVDIKNRIRNWMLIRNQDFEFRYGPHNQYNEYLMRFGIWLALPFLFMIILPIYKSIVQKKYLYLIVSTHFFLVYFTDDYLVSRMGVFIFAFMNSLFYFHYLNHKHNQ